MSTDLSLRFIVATTISVSRLAMAQTACEPLPRSKLERLSNYVQQKYKLSFPLRIEAEDISLVKNTCFRRLKFRSVSATRDFVLALYVSPDGRFLSKDLFDSSSDPGAEEQKNEQLLLKSLLATKAPSLGRMDSPVAITVFSDFQCPFCKQQAMILRERVAPFEPDVRIMFRNLPLSIHDWSRQAAMVAPCAARQSDEAFWILHDLLFQLQGQLRPDNISAEIEHYVGSVGANLVDPAQLKVCIERGDSLKEVELDVALAGQIEVVSTPTVFVNSFRINGVASEEQLRTLIHQIRETTSR